MALRTPYKSIFLLVICLIGHVVFYCPVVSALNFSKEQIFQMATLAARDGAYESAVGLYKKVLDVDPRFAPAYNGLGLVYESWNGGDMDEAVRYFKLATEVDPAYVECQNNLGRAYYSQGNFIQAEKVFLRSLELNPQQPDIELALAWLYLLGQSEAEKAVSRFEKALLGVDNAMAYYGLGLAHLDLGEKMKVLDDITALRRHGKEPEAAALEKMLRENVRITSHPGTPLITGKDMGESVFEKELKSLQNGGSDADKGKEGIQVRLKGPLWSQ